MAGEVKGEKEREWRKRTKVEGNGEEGKKWWRGRVREDFAPRKKSRKVGVYDGSV